MSKPIDELKFKDGTTYGERKASAAHRQRALRFVNEVLFAKSFTGENMVEALAQEFEKAEPNVEWIYDAGFSGFVFCPDCKMFGVPLSADKQCGNCGYAPTRRVFLEKD